jgi:hypothetical protein
VKTLLLLACALPIVTGGCIASNLAQVIDALAKDNNQNCIVVTSVYGTVTMMRAAPNASFKAGAGSCDIQGNPEGGKIAVPVQVPAMTLTPTTK